MKITLKKFNQIKMLDELGLDRNSIVRGVKLSHATVSRVIHSKNFVEYFKHFQRKGHKSKRLITITKPDINYTTWAVWALVAYQVFFTVVVIISVQSLWTAVMNIK